MWNSDNLNVIIGACALLVAIIAFGNEIAETTSIKTFGKVWFKILITFISFLFGIIATIKKDREFSKELELRDSLNNSQLQTALAENSNKNIETYTSALAKYHLEYIQSQNRVISYLKDSSTKEIPDFGLIYSDQAVIFNYNTSKDSCIGNVSFRNSGNCPIKVSLKLSIACEKNNILTIVPFKLNVLNEEILSIDEPYNFPIHLYGYDKDGIDNVYLLAQGNFKSLKSKNEYPIDRLIQWSFGCSCWGSPMMVSEQNRIRKFFKSNV